MGLLVYIFCMSTIVFNPIGAHYSGTVHCLNYSDSFKMRTFTNSEDSDKMSHYVVYHQDLHHLLRQKGS